MHDNRLSLAEIETRRPDQQSKRAEPMFKTWLPSGKVHSMCQKRKFTTALGEVSGGISGTICLFLVSIFVLTHQAQSVPYNLTSSVRPTVRASPFIPSTSFATTYKLTDGEIVTKVRWNNLTAIETRFRNTNLIQIIKEERIIQLWLSNDDLVDCEYTNDHNTIENVHKEFYKINPNSEKDYKSFKIIEEYKNFTSLPENFKRLSEYEKYEAECAQLHKKVLSFYKKNENRIKKSKSSRAKRSLLVYPGTKWCGKGSNSQHFEDLGDYSFADRCCRDHDRCRYSIGPFDTRYHLSNYGFHYVSHCSCDERFRSCLKVANSGNANLVGKIYFNVVKTKCFMFQIGEFCEEQSWWGSCLKNRRRKRAVYRDPMTY